MPHSPAKHDHPDDGGDEPMQVDENVPVVAEPAERYVPTFGSKRRKPSKPSTDFQRASSLRRASLSLRLDETVADKGGQASTSRGAATSQSRRRSSGIARSKVSRSRGGVEVECVEWDEEEA